MTQQPPTFGKTVADAAALAAAIGLDAAAIDSRVPAQEVSRARPLIVPVTSRKSVDAAVLDRAKIDALFAASGMQRRGIYIFTAERAQDDATAYSRLLGTGGIEDPATGSAAGPAGAFMAKHGFVPGTGPASIVFLQGVLVRGPAGCTSESTAPAPRSAA